MNSEAYEEFKKRLQIKESISKEELSDSTYEKLVKAKMELDVLIEMLKDSSLNYLRNDILIMYNEKWREIKELEKQLEDSYNRSI